MNQVMSKLDMSLTFVVKNDNFCHNTTELTYVSRPIYMCITVIYFGIICKNEIIVK